MTIEEAATALRERLQGAPWLTAVGVGEHDHAPCIYLYVTSAKRPEIRFLKHGWNGYPVEVRQMASPRLAHDPLSHEPQARSSGA